MRFKKTIFSTTTRVVAAFVAAVYLFVGCGIHQPGPDVALDGDQEAQDALVAKLYRPTLGVGVDFSETKTYRTCVTVPLESTRHAFADRLYTEQAVTSRDELNEAMGIEASFTAKGLWGQASGSASYFKNVKMTSDAFYWFVDAHYQLVDQGIDTGNPNFQLTAEAKRLLQGPNGLNAFYEGCGRYFYSGVSKGARYSLLYEFRSSEEKTIERIKALASYSGWGVQAKASFEKLAEMAHQASVLKVYAASQGGGTRLASYARSPDLLERELSILRDDLYTHGKGVESEWVMSDYNMFPEIHEARSAARAEHRSENPDPDPDKLIKDAAMATLYRAHTSNIEIQQKIARRLDASAGTEPLYAYGEEKRLGMQTLLRQLDDNNREIALKAKTCLHSTAPDACSVSDAWTTSMSIAQAADGILPPDRDYSTLQNWSLHFSQKGDSKRFLDLEGRPNDPARNVLTLFNTGNTLYETVYGVVAEPDDGGDFGAVIGQSIMVRDPVSGQYRPKICVHEFSSVCSLRVVPLPYGKGSDPTAVKLQLVLFNDYGFVEKRLDFPVANY